MPTDPEDRLAEILADRVIDMVAASLPHAGPVMRRRAARLYLRQITGRAAPHGYGPQRSVAAVAATMGISRSQVTRLETRAILKMKDSLRRRGESFDSLISLITPKQEP
jgi:DNA-directed RNA polymerase sigma subunit (sigma70/sigma32)